MKNITRLILLTFFGLILLTGTAYCVEEASEMPETEMNTEGPTKDVGPKGGRGGGRGGRGANGPGGQGGQGGRGRQGRGQGGRGGQRGGDRRGARGVQNEGGQVTMEASLMNPNFAFLDN